MLAPHWRRRKWGPHLCCHGEIVAGRHDADHGEVLIVEADILTYYGCIPAEPPLPKAIAQDNDAIAAELILVGLKGPSPYGLHADYVEKVRRRQRLRHPLGLTTRPHQVGHAAGPCRDAAQVGALSGKVREICGCDRGPVVRSALAALDNGNK